MVSLREASLWSVIWAALALRATYSMLSGAVDRFHMLKFGLAVALVIVGLKMVWLNETMGGKLPSRGRWGSSLRSWPFRWRSRSCSRSAMPRKVARQPGPLLRPERDCPEAGVCGRE